VNCYEDQRQNCSFLAACGDLEEGPRDGSGVGSSFAAVRTRVEQGSGVWTAQVWRRRERGNGSFDVESDEG
jgi:hypothetical protein